MSEAVPIIDLALYREQSEQLRHELAEVEAQRARLVRAIRANETLIAASLKSEQPLLPLDCSDHHNGWRPTTRHGRAIGKKLNKTDRKVLRIINSGPPISFADLRARSGVNEWTLRDCITRLMVAGEVKRFGLARATRFAKATIKTERDTSLLGFLVNK